MVVPTATLAAQVLSTRYLSRFAITQPVVWIVRPEAQAQPDLGRGRSTVRRFGTRVAHIASFPPLGVAFMYLYRNVQTSHAAVSARLQNSRKSRVLRHEARLCHTPAAKRLFRAITSKTNGSNRAR
jgi:hypothetical protein